MHVDEVLTALEQNRKVLVPLLEKIPEKLIHWKENPKGWSLLEIVCHLVDEEILDFRARVLHALNHPEAPLVPIDPIGWISTHQYSEQDFGQKLATWNQERTKSIEIITQVKNMNWENQIEHPDLGAISARSFLFNWLAHDYHHIRQINRIKYNYLKHTSGDSLGYAGNW